MPVAWTIAQRAAIRHQGSSLLVSAAAGSGKTAVLAERCAYLVCDAPDPCDIDELLVVTFTETAAAEMRGRIQKSLAERLGADPTGPPRLLKQLALVEHAHISTIHGFCARLLRQNFSLVGLDPRFQVIDPDEAALLRRQVAAQLFEDRYEQDSTGRLQAFIDAYGNGQDESLREQIIAAHELLCSLTSPRQWLARSMDQLAQAAKPLKDSDLGRHLLAAVQSALAQLQRRCDAAIATMRGLKIFPDYATRLGEWSVLISQWRQSFQSAGYDALRSQVRDFDPPLAPRVKPDMPNKDRAKSLLDSVKDQMREGELSKLLAFTEPQWLQGQQSILPHAVVFAELVLEFSRRYAQAKSAARGVDFSDLERKTLELLAENRGDDLCPSPVARACHRQYKHVLVDEYQDVNEIQDAILALLSTECVAGEGHYSPNLFTVGDVKQSIYRFRLAEPQRFLDRGKRFRQGNQVGKVIDLQENFRSRPPLLDAINNVFQRLMSEESAEIEYDQTHFLHPPAHGEHAQIPGPPIELHVLPNIGPADSDEQDLNRAEYEATLCARRIQELVGNDAVKYGDIAILLRSMKYKADNYAAILRRHGIPVHNTGGSGFFQASEVVDMISLLSLLDNQRQDIPLAAFFRSPLAGLNNPQDVLAKIALLARAEQISFHQAAARLPSDLPPLLSRLSQWRDLARQRPLAELIWHIYDQTGYLTYVAGLEDGAQRVANLLYLHQRARQFGGFLKQGLHRFMAFLSQLREETDLSLPSISSEGESSVRIMSIHRSKGLEFPVLILPDLGKQHNLSDSHGNILLDRRSGMALRVVDQSKRIIYPSLSSTVIAASLRRQSLAEELRLLYVSMTRAQQRLILVGTDKQSAPDEWAGEFSGHCGPMAANDFLRAQSMLDWIGPVQAMCGPATMGLTRYTPDQLAAWAQAASRQPNQRLTDIAALKPLEPAPPITPEAAAVIARLGYVYPHQIFTTQQAATAATRFSAVIESEISSPKPQIPTLPLPTFLSAESLAPLSASEIGQATHVILEHLDYSRSCDLPDVHAQVAEMVARGYLQEFQAAAVDHPAIAWLAASELGAALKSHARRLLREIPFAASIAGASADPADAVMLRGRIDLLVPTAGGLAIVDYKTDRVTAMQASQRADEYAGQIQVYRDALQRVTGKKVTAAYLVFLTPRLIWNVSFENL